VESNGSVKSGNGTSTGGIPVDRMFDLFVCKPVGFALNLVGAVVNRGFGSLGADEKVRQAEAKVRQARTIGQFAVTFGGRQVRKEVDARLGDALRRAGSIASHLPGFPGSGAPDGPMPAPATEPEAAATARHTAARQTAAPAAPSAPAPAVAPEAEPEAVATARATAARQTAVPASPPDPAAGVVSPSAADLPITSYDGLSASQVVQRLSGLSREELEAVRAYEAGARARKTVLVAIERLTR
jgi:hypothetical protein